jgi:hypothetical protein
MYVSEAGKRVMIANRGKGFYDIRRDTKSADKLAAIRARVGKNAAAVADARDEFVRGESELRSRVPTLKVEYNDTLQIPEVIGPDPTQGRGSLTGQANAARAEILRNFVRENAGLVGLSHSQADELIVTADYTNPGGELSFASLEQRVNGIPVFQGELKAGFTKRGEMFRVVNNLAPDLDHASISQEFGDASSAVRTAANDIGTDISFYLAAGTQSDDLRVTFGQGDDAPTAEKMYFPTEPGVAVPAWRVLIWTDGKGYYEVVDAATNTILWRKCITDDQTQSATYNVYAATNNLAKALDSPSPGNPSPVFPGGPDPASVPSYQPEPVSRTSVTLIGNEGPLSFNNLGWMTDNTNGANGETQGNAVIAGVDLVAPDGIETTQPGTNRVFNFNYTPSGVTGASVPPYTCCTEIGEAPGGAAFRSGVVTHLFYLTNRYHDALYQAGFTESARNFQNDNFGRGGAGNDRVLAQAQDFSGTNNANFATPADGTSGRMQMYLFTNGTAAQRDGSLDANVVFHELTHGVSNRLIGNGSGLGTLQAGGMGEGWGDLFAFLLLSKTNDPVNAIYSTGGYATYKLGNNNTYTKNYYYGIRRFPYAVRSFTGGPNNRPHNPLTFADIDPSQANLLDGAYPPSPVIGGPADEEHNEGELWAVTGIEVWSRLVTRLGHDAGTLKTLQLYTDGMKLSPLNPTFLQERNAILAAAQVGGSAADVADVWAAFAARGMGFSATNPGGNSVVQAFDLPNLTQTAAITVDDSAGNHNGFPDPGELVTLTVPVSNNTGQNATGVTFQLVGGGSANVASLPNNTTLNVQLQLTVPSVFGCGNSLPITINANSSLGPTAFNRSLLIGSPVATLSQNFDGVTAPAIPAGWTAESGLGGINFVTTTTSADSAPNSAYAVDPAANAGEARLISPSVNIVAPAATMSFRHRFDTEAAWDGGVLEIKIGGGSFTDIVTAGGTFLSNGYNGTMTAASPSPTYTPNPLNGRNGWTGNSGGFITTAVQLPGAAAGQNVQFRWRMGADDNTSGTGPNPGWYIDTVVINGSFICVDPPTHRAPFDFDGDGRTDISIFRPSVGEWWYSRSSDSQVRVGQFGNSSDILTPGDFTGDGKADIAFWRPSTGEWFILRSEDNSYFSFPFGSNGDIPAPADFDHDGKTDVAVFRPAVGTWFILPSSGGPAIITQFGLNGDKPVAADYDGDGKADIAIVRNNGGNKEWWIQRSSAGVAVAIFGVTADQAVPGDFTGDGKADIAVWRPSTGQWFVLRSEDNSYYSLPFGSNGDVPVPGDYDGDGKFDTAVFRPASNTWFVDRSAGGAPIITGFGSAGDIPVPGAFVR